MRASTSMAAGDHPGHHLSVILREPLGVTGVITPWNYPLLMAAWKLAPVLAAGDTLVDPADHPEVRRTRRRSPAARRVNVVNGYGAIAGARLAEHPDVDMIALTCSVASGRAVARAAAGSLKRVHLELGGKAPAAIFPDADPAAAASALRVAGLWNSGQECGAACRVLAHDPIAEEFVERLAGEVRTLAVGEPPAGEDVEDGPMAPRAHFDRVTGCLERAEAEGVRVATGGGALDGPGYFVAPTVPVDVPEGAEVAREEIFGPVITVETFTDEGEAVRRADDVPLGRPASVRTENARRAHAVAARLDSGTVRVNSHLVLASEVPWGGFKGSGSGRDLSVYTLDDYARTEHVMHNHER
ncbi:aldehyde dehydrogenase family protein [Streptomyces purpurascens]|uniref:aldehyde dehydrogenase family protein n=1 Tax=Streptomyces purpurascens TaxID=1924 RepID=UPI0033DEA8D6